MLTADRAHELLAYDPDGRKVNLGRYAELSEAQRAYASASARYHGAFAPAHVAAHGC
jgi:hypothetical protein